MIASDITFEVGEETFRAHKLILAAGSPVFRDQFFGLIRNTNIDKVVVEDVEPAIFKVFYLNLISTVSSLPSLMGLEAKYEDEAFLPSIDLTKLWDLLLKSVDRTRKRICPSYPKDVYTRGCDGVVNDKHKVLMLKGLQSHAKGNDNILCNDEKEYCPVTFAPQLISSDDIEVSRRRSTGLNNSRNGINDKEVVSIYSDGVPLLRRYLAKKELQSRNSQSVERENPNNIPSAEMNADEPVFPSKSVVSDSRHNPKPRGNVWDRLGKPEQRNVRVETMEVEDVDLVKDGIVENPGEAHDQKTSVLFGRLGRRLMGETPALDNGHISKTNGEYKRLDHDLNAVCSPHHAGSYYKKREFNEIGSGPANGSISLRGRNSKHLQDREPLEEFQRSSSAKCSRSENVNNIASGTRQTGGIETCQALGDSAFIPGLETCQAFGVPNSAFIPGVNGVSQRNFCKEVLEETYANIRDDGILVIPTVKRPPPQCGLKEVSVPLGFHDNCPVSVSFIAKNGSDEKAAAANTLAARCKATAMEAREAYLAIRAEIEELEARYSDLPEVSAHGPAIDRQVDSLEVGSAGPAVVLTAAGEVVADQPPVVGGLGGTLTEGVVASPDLCHPWNVLRVAGVSVL
ncbi:hypothetical protein IFM89_011405 [Coptis chinensis]|uniref:BTB domain-containing protein n=1 Tax=Coptis chinensis TaxID=261450 RepID=A0A835HPI4_9MAGN|nr:hypothetical protein IFM89_011405 [Coptis chinensis]